MFDIGWQELFIIGLVTIIVIGPKDLPRVLRAVTLGSAYLLGLDEDLGSIETGKWADFTVLAESPLDVDPMAIKDIKVWGTVLAGVKQPGAGAAALEA